MSIGQRIRELREKKKFNQEYVAQYLGLKTQQISAYENDKSEPPVSKLLKLGQLFNVQISYFVGEEMIQLKNENESEDTKFLRDQITLLNEEKRELVAIIKNLTSGKPPGKNNRVVSMHDFLSHGSLKLAS